MPPSLSADAQPLQGVFGRIKGVTAQQVRFASGLILFGYVLTHLINHAFGIVSLEAMEAAQKLLGGAWETIPGQFLLYGSAIVHVAFGLVKIARMRTLRRPPMEWFQILLVVLIPYQMVAHVVGTRGLAQNFEVEMGYPFVLNLMWPGLITAQSLFMIAVWLHGCLGLHFWLGARRWYGHAFPWLLALAVLVPALALWGWIDAARRIALVGLETDRLTRAMIQWAIPAIDNGRMVAHTLLAVAFAMPVVVPLARRASAAWTRRYAVTYPGNVTVRSAAGPTLLEISRANNIPHTSICGGRARCSTCRVLVVDGLENQPEKSAAEHKVLDRFGDDERIRLACQLRPNADLAVQPLVPVDGALATGTGQDAYHWGVEREVVIMFADLRNFTGLSEARLPFDVVFLLNRYLGLMSEAIRGAGGHVDKFIGDGIMAIFGMDTDPKTAARQALVASAAMADALDLLNQEFASSDGIDLRIGVGLHAGPAILGRIGAAGAGGAAAGITALGDTVNAASRLESATKELKTFLAISAETYALARPDQPDAIRRSTITVKGKTEPLDVLAIDDPRILRNR
ncbi:MAG: adenylate/guanylate cyclase domain-containing protein [Pseudomonadota bacterium]